MLPLPTSLQDALSKLTDRAINFVQKNVLKSLGTTIASTLLIIFCLINPWFGSSSAKYHLMKFMIGSDQDVSAIIEMVRKDGDDAFKSDFIKGAGTAGLYEQGDKAILSRWVDSLPDDPSQILDETKLDQKQYAAVLLARERSLNRRPPFQAIGLEGVGTSPSCPTTRPGTGQVYVNIGTDFGRQVRPGQRVMIVRADGQGRPVVAVVNLIPGMPDGVDVYLNRRQMVAFLGYVDQKPLSIRLTITNLAPNQDVQDRSPPEVKIDCSRG